MAGITNTSDLAIASREDVLATQIINAYNGLSAADQTIYGPMLEAIGIVVGNYPKTASAPLRNLQVGMQLLLANADIGDTGAFTYVAGGLIANGATVADFTLEAGFEYVLAMAISDDSPNLLAAADFDAIGDLDGLGNQLLLTSVNDFSAAPTAALDVTFAPTNNDGAGVLVFRKGATDVTDLLGGTTVVLTQLTGAGDTLTLDNGAAANSLSLVHADGGGTGNGGYILARRPLSM